MAIAGSCVWSVGAARSLVAGSAVLLSTGLVSASPVAVAGLGLRTSAQTYTLTASSALRNVPLNMLNLALSMPAWEVQAMNRLADAMIGTGSWQVWGPTNVLGFDEWDPPKLAGVIDMMIPVQPFSSVIGEQINSWAKANFPMNAGCAAAAGACPDFWTAARGNLTVPASQLIKGYQFPAVTNPFTLQPTPWSGQYVKVEPGAAFASLWNYLNGDPKNVQTVPIGDYFNVPLKLARSIFSAYYPFVQNSEWFNPTTPFSWAFRPLAPVICPSCGPEPYDNPWLDENYPPKPTATTNAPLPAAAVGLAAGGEQFSPAPATPPAADPVAPPTSSSADQTAVPEPQTIDGPVSPPTSRTAEGGVRGHRGATGADQSAARASGVRATTRGGYSTHSAEAR